MFKMQKKAQIKSGENSGSDIFALYEKGRRHHEGVNMYKESEQFNSFYEGNQWEGFEGADEMPRLNFIKPVGKHKISSIAQNQVAMVFSQNATKNSHQELCDMLNKLALAQWERSNMDALAFETIKNAFIAGEHYIYCSPKSVSLYCAWSPQLIMRGISKTSVYFEDEENSNLEEQKYIILSGKMSVSDVKSQAHKNGIPKEQIELIVPDDSSENEKCTVLLYMEKTENGMAFSRSVKEVVFEKTQTIEGLFRYPLARMKWESSDMSARGISGVKYLIPNQLEVNKTLARRAVAVRRFSFPTLAYDKNAISNVDDLSKIGSSIAIDNARDNPIDKIVQYLNPAPISADASRLQDELISLSKELEGAGDAATGQVDPTRASGEAIKAARDQAAIPLNEQVCAYKAFMEDLAHVWLSMWMCYGKNGIAIESENLKSGGNRSKCEVITQKELCNLGANIKIDITPIDPYSRLSAEISMERLLSKGNITFEEYVDSLDDTSGIPKAKLKQIISARQNINRTN